MRRGSTPTNTFTVEIDLRNATVYVSYEQDGAVVLEKTGDALTVSSTSIVLQLTQEETMLFHPGKVLIQIAYVFPDGSADRSDIISTTFERIIKDEVIYP